MTHFVPDNMSNEEAFRLFGTLPASRIEILLNSDIDSNTISDAKDILSGINVNYPGHLTQVLEQELRELLLHTRGDNRRTVESALDYLEMIEKEILREIRGAREEIDNAIQHLEQRNV